MSLLSNESMRVPSCFFRLSRSIQSFRGVITLQAALSPHALLSLLFPPSFFPTFCGVGVWVYDPQDAVETHNRVPRHIFILFQLFA